MAEIAAIVVSLISPVIELGKLIFSPIKRQFSYLCCFNSNIQRLQNESEKLKTERDGLQMRVNAENRNIQVIVPKVNEWLDASDKIQAKKSDIEVEIENVKRGCSATQSHYSRSRKAKKTAEAMKDLRARCNFEEISVPPPPSSMAPIRQQTTDEFESRKQIEEKIMKDLRGRKVHMMGICGMGGVGKTNMAKKIMKKVREENVFEEVVMVVVSQEVRLPEIQCAIAENLGLKLDDETLSVRACKLHARLMGAKSILLILDDVWEELNLEDLGIPCKSDLGERCAIVLTSRNESVLLKMDAKSCAMKILTQNESWSLFREKVGTWVDDSELLSIVKEVEKECKGLPLALVIVGMTLKNEKSKSIWEDALHQLRSSNPAFMPDVLRDVYKPLKLSYDFLENPAVRSLFLLCCLFPEDHEIPLEHLTVYGLGLGMFDGITSVEQARNRSCTLFKMLKGHFLLQDGYDENHVRMHDVVRDVAIFIASEEGRVRNLSSIDSSSEESINCAWISVVVEQINKLSVGLSFPNLQLLLINNDYPDRLESLDKYFFRGMAELKVLSFRRIQFELPETTQLLKKLRTLHLENCPFFKTIAVVGELRSLEILICRHVEIEELPAEIRRLEGLKVLEFSYCSRLRKIAPGVISNLVQLEELVIEDSFQDWETKVGKRENAALCELEHLKNLTTLRIEIANAALAAEEICLSSKLVKYDIQLLGTSEVAYYHQEDYLYERNVTLNSDITVGKWIQVCASTEFLYVIGEGARTLDIAQTQKMKAFVLENCSMVKEVVNLTASMDRSVGVFPLLKSLRLGRLSNLEEICDGPIPKSSNSFRNLKSLRLEELPALQQIWKSPHQNVSLCNLSEIELWGCDKLRELFPLAIAREGLPELKSLIIGLCPMLEQVFLNDEDENGGEQCHIITFPKLHYLYLQDLPKIQSFRNGRQHLQFPSLEDMNIFSCRSLFEFFLMEYVSTPNLKTIETGCDSVSNIWGHQAPLGFFRQLQKLEITEYNGIKSLFSSSIAANLQNLESLIIDNCCEMIKVIEDDEEILCEKSDLVFPRLKNVSLSDLPKLERFCNLQRNLQLPSLENVSIGPCPLLEFFTIKSVKLERLKRITIRDWNFSTSLFPYSIAENLVNLEELDIRKCNEMIQVIDDDEEELLCTKSHNLLFPCLKKLQFENLPKLESFWNWRYDLKLLSLEHVMIMSCPLFRRFSSMGSVATPNLKYIQIDSERVKSDGGGKVVGDLNSVIRNTKHDSVTTLH